MPEGGGRTEGGGGGELAPPLASEPTHRQRQPLDLGELVQLCSSSMMLVWDSRAVPLWLRSWVASRRVLSARGRRRASAGTSASARFLTQSSLFRCSSPRSLIADLVSPLNHRSLQIIDVTYPMGLGEPLNIILSADSTKEVLVDSKSDGGLRNYFLAMDFSESCLGLAATGGQKANLGDGQGVCEFNKSTSRGEDLGDPLAGSKLTLCRVCCLLSPHSVNQTDELRYNFGDIYFGTCRETFEGGNHFRYWTQKTTGAVFMASVLLPRQLRALVQNKPTVLFLLQLTVHR